MLDKDICDKGFIWNPSNSEFEWGKSCDIGKYLDYKNCKCKKKLVDKLVKECSEYVDGNNSTLNGYEQVCNSCIIYIVLLIITFLTIIGISSAFIYFDWYLKKIIFA